MDSFLSQLWEVFQNKKALCGEWLSEIWIYVQGKNPWESYIILRFHLIQALVAYGRQTQESPVLKILALIARDCKIKQITLEVEMRVSILGEAPYLLKNVSTEFPHFV